MSSRRLSVGGSALRDVSNGRSNSRGRLSIGGAARRTETPQKDRRDALEEWKRNSKTRDPANDSENMNTDSKRTRILMDGPPPLPPSSTQKFVENGTTALERYRLKKQLKQQQQQQEQSSLPPRSSSHTTSISSATGMVLSDDVEEEGSFNSGSHTSTPSRRRLVSSRARRRSQTPHQRTDDEDHQSSQTPCKRTVEEDCNETPSRARRRSFVPKPEPEQLNQFHSQHSTESDHNSTSQNSDNIGGGSVEAGLRSRLREMELRIEQLETDKTKLLVDKAPLEALLQQKDEELKRCQNDNEALKQENLKIYDKISDLQATYDTIESENKRLRLEVKKPTNPSSYRPSTETTKWSRSHQNDSDYAELKKQLRNALDDIEYMRGENVSLEKELRGTKIELKAVSRALDELQAEHDVEAKSMTEIRDAEIKLLTTEHIATAAQLNAVYQDLADTKARTEAEARAKEEEYKKTLEEMRFQLSVATNRAATLGGDTEERNDDAAVWRARFEEQFSKFEEQVRRNAELEKLRRHMHNRIQELQGNIRVFVRARPFLPGDGQQNEPAVHVSPDGESLAIEDMRSSKTHKFSFDKVFPPSAGQDKVFDEVSDFVQSALDGYHVCLFSYGQTGSGKTHTMQGSGTSSMRGIIPRAVEQILSQARVLKTDKWEFKICASFLEIYNEELKDLLARKAQNEQGKLSIKRSRMGKSYVDGLSEIEIDTDDVDLGMEQLNELMAVAARARSVASTKMNNQSSRSHSVFMLHLRGSNEDTGAEVQGALNLCDLAGSERLDRSEVASDATRLRETQAINKSLSCLGDVFNALAQGASHVPYRNSKLTYLLQDCLSGDGKALMFVNLSPTPASSNESLCSLRFAQRVNQVELGKPTKHIQYKNL